MKPEIIEQRNAIKNAIVAQLIDLAGPGVYTFDGGVSIHAPNNVTLEFDWVYASYTRDATATLDCVSVDFGYYNPAWRRRFFKSKNGSVNVAGIHKAVSEFAAFCEACAKRKADADAEKKALKKALAQREAQLREHLSNAKFIVESVTETQNESELLVVTKHEALKSPLLFRATKDTVKIELSLSYNIDDTVWVAHNVCNLLLALQNKQD